MLRKEEFATPDELRLQLDLRLTQAPDDGDDLELRGAIDTMHRLIRTSGGPVRADALAVSDVPMLGPHGRRASIRSLLHLAARLGD